MPGVGQTTVPDKSHRKPGGAIDDFGVLAEVVLIVTTEYVDL